MSVWLLRDVITALEVRCVKIAICFCLKMKTPWMEQLQLFHAARPDSSNLALISSKSLITNNKFSSIQLKKQIQRQFCKYVIEVMKNSIP